ncbi:MULTISPECIES: DUF5105 domain-containing protein [Clostridium]|uniref:DUF5105 domain-containing protein n=1 Tax=Clostridium TaxID=1485 RepID=UPI0008256851|nr:MULTISPECIES: DUF5105 domain-containing protein [Clostridium]
MRKSGRPIKVLLAALLIPIVLIGCAPKIKPDESAKIMCNFIIKNDKTKISELVSDQKEVNGYYKKLKDSFTNKLKDGVSGEGVNISDDQYKQICDAYLKAIKNITITTKQVSVDGDTAVVNVKTNYIDMNEIVKKAEGQATEDIMSMGLTDEEEAKNKAVEVYLKYVIQDLNEAKPKSETINKDFKFKKGGQGWIPQDENDFEKQLGKMICKE